MAFNVGELVAYLRLDYGDFERGAATAQTTADRLDGTTVDIKVDADTALAEAKFAEVAAQEDRVDAGNKKVAASGQQAGQGMGVLANAIILLGPALVPVAAGLAGLTVGFGALGAAGVLAVVGIKEQMAAGTTVGLGYTAMMATLKGDLTTLAGTAAGGVLTPLQRSVADLQNQMPNLNTLIGEFSGIAGRTAGSLVTGLVAAFISLAPLARDAGVYILNLSNRFAAMMSGPGVVAFGDYARTVFPQVMQALTAVGDAAIHLVAALAPLGMGGLSILQTLASVINALPVNVLSALAVAATGVYVSVSLFKLLIGPVEALSAAMLAAGTAEEVVATGIQVLKIAVGSISAIVGLAVIAFSVFSDSQRQNTQAANDFADALRQDNGLLAENVRQTAAQKLQASGALEAGRQLGLSLSTLTDYALGNAGAMQQVNTVTETAAKAAHALTAASGPAANSTYENYQAALKLRPALADVNNQLKSETQKYKDIAEATATSTAATTPLTAAQAALAAKLGMTSAALVTATAGQKTTAQAAVDAAAKMQIENDAAGLLKTQLDALNGKGLSLMQAQTASAAATNAAAAALKANQAAIEGNSDAAIKNQQALQGKAQASQAEAEAVGKATGSTEAAVKAYEDSKTALEGALKAQGLLTPAVQAYIDKLYDVNNLKVQPTKLDADTALAAQKVADFQAMVNGVHGSTVTLSVTAAFDSTVQAVLGAQRAGITLNLPGHAAGGLITGPGSGTSDSILGVNASGVPITRVSANEFVVNANATAKNRQLLEAINSGQQVGGASSGGVVTLSEESSNRLAATMASMSQNIALSLATGQARTAANTRTTQTRRW